MRLKLIFLFIAFLSFESISAQRFKDFINKNFVIMTHSFSGLDRKVQEAETNFILTDCNMVQIHEPSPGFKYIYVYKILSRQIIGNEYHIKTKDSTGNEELWILTNLNFERTWQGSKDKVVFLAPGLAEIN